MPRPFDASDIGIEKRGSRLYDNARPAQKIGRDPGDIIHVAVGQNHDLTGTAGGGFERGPQVARSRGGSGGVERRDAGAEPPDDRPTATPRERPRAIERRAPRRSGHTERSIEQHDRLSAGGEESSARGIPEQQDQRQDRGHPQNHERHASASATVNLPSYSARPTQAPARPAARVARRSSSDPTPPDTMTSRPSAASWRAVRSRMSPVPRGATWPSFASMPTASRVVPWRATSRATRLLSTAPRGPITTRVAPSVNIWSMSVSRN